MFKIYLCLTTQHDWRQALFAVLVCAVSTLATFFLYARTPAGPSWRRGVWLGTTAVVAGSGVWTMHFVAMLAFQTGLPAVYGPAATAESLLAAIASMGLGFTFGVGPSGGARGRWTAVGGGLIVGLGLTLTHYVAMSGYRTEGFVRWDGAYVTASVLVGTALAAGALYTAGPGATAARQLAAAARRTTAVVGMHFLGMTAVTIWPDPDMTVSPVGLSNGMLAWAAAGGACLIIAAAMAGVLFDSFSRQDALRRLSEALDVMPETVAVYDANGRLESWNARFAANSGLAESALAGSTFEDLCRARLSHGAYLEAIGHETEFLAVRQAEFDAATGSREFQRNDGRWVRVTHRRTASGGTVSSAVDVTMLKQAEADMARARDEALAASRIKSEFLANMSHEIRTPMNGILGMNSLMLLSPLSGDQRLYAETVQSSAQSLLRILNDILDMSKLDAGKVQLEAVEFSIEALTRDVIRLVDQSAEQKGVALAYETAPGWFVGDPGRIRQVLLNLVTNAVKFTSEGSVRVRVTARPLDERTLLRVDVSDTGIGLTEQAKQRLFQPFEQADNSITRRFAGTGLGLSICHQLVQLMDGRIGMDDRPGGGSIFWFEVPLAPAQPLAQPLRQTA